MPQHEGFQRRLVPAAEEGFQQLPIGHPRPAPQQYRPAKLADDLAHLAGRHVIALVVGVFWPLLLYYRHAASLIQDFPDVHAYFCQFLWGAAASGLARRCPITYQHPGPGLRKKAPWSKGRRLFAKLLRTSIVTRNCPGSLEP